MKSIYVGNLPYTADEAEIRALFEEFGTVDSVKLVSDRDTGRPRGFGFVEMPDDDADAAIRELDGRDFNGRGLRVNEARRREQGGGRGHHGPGGRGPRHHRA